MSASRCGDPLADETVDYGPLINEAGFRKVETLVGGAVAAGATVVTGGKRAAGEGGHYYSRRFCRVAARTWRSFGRKSSVR